MSDSAQPVRFAVWGAGVMGERIARAAAQTAGVTVAAVIDTDPARAQRVAGALDALPCGDLAGAVAIGVEAVYIGLPNALHHAACLAAAEAGLHVLIDKPLTTSPAEAGAIVAAAQASGTHWMMGFSYRFRSEWRRMRELIAQGAIGRPYFVSDNVIEAYRATPAWYWDPAAGGGTLQLQGHHVFDRWEWVIGAPVTAISAATAPAAGVESDLVAVLSARFANGALGSSAMSFGVRYNAAPRVRFTVQGEDGMFEVDETRRLVISDDAGIREEVFADDWLLDEVASFFAGVRGAAAGLPTVADGARAVLLAAAAEQSAVSGEWVPTDREVAR